MFLHKNCEESQKIFETIFEQSYNLVVVTDAQIELPGPKFLYVNKAFTDKTGYTIEELQDETPRILQGEKTNKKLLVELKECLKKGEYFTGSTVNYTKDNQEYYVEWNISPIRDENGKIVYFASVQRDITEKKLYEQKLKKEQSEKMLAFKQLALKELLQRVAHHWRQPLAEIGMGLATVQTNYAFTQSLDTDLEENLSMIQEAVDTTKELSDTIDSFKEFTLTDASFEDNVNLKELFLKILKLYALDIKQNKIKIKLSIKEGFVLRTHKQEFMQVLIHCIDNSFYFLKARKIQDGCITLKASQSSDGYVITLEDNAGGIGSHNTAELFEPYFSTKEEKNNTGLGLYLAKNAIESILQGELSIENTTQGVMVKLLLPQ